MTLLSIHIPLCDEVAYSPLHDSKLFVILGIVCAVGLVALFFFIRRKRK